MVHSVMFAFFVGWGLGDTIHLQVLLRKYLIDLML